LHFVFAKTLAALAWRYISNKAADVVQTFIAIGTLQPKRNAKLISVAKKSLRCALPSGGTALGVPFQPIIPRHGGRAYTVDRVKTDGVPLKIPNLSIAVTGGIQPDKLSSLLLKGDDDGLAGRFLLVWPEPIPPKRPTDYSDTSQMLTALRRISALTPSVDEFENPAPKVIVLSDAAAAGNRRAPIWHPQMLDGLHPLSDENTEACCYGNVFACAVLQSQTGYEDRGCRPTDRGHEGGIEVCLPLFMPYPA
jgi:hypothetical protein